MAAMPGSSAFAAAVTSACVSVSAVMRASKVAASASASAATSSGGAVVVAVSMTSTVWSAKKRQLDAQEDAVVAMGMEELWALDGSAAAALPCTCWTRVECGASCA